MQGTRRPYSRTSWKVNSANFAFTEFSEVRPYGVLEAGTKAIFFYPNGGAQATISRLPRAQLQQLRLYSSVQKPPRGPPLPSLLLEEAPPHRCIRGSEPCIQAACLLGPAAQRGPSAQTKGAGRGKTHTRGL